jgi:hypothetical protein
LLPVGDDGSARSPVASFLGNDRAEIAQDQSDDRLDNVE